MTCTVTLVSALVVTWEGTGVTRTWAAVWAYDGMALQLCENGDKAISRQAKARTALRPRKTGSERRRIPIMRVVLDVE